MFSHVNQPVKLSFILSINHFTYSQVAFIMLLISHLTIVIAVPSAVTSHIIAHITNHNITHSISSILSAPSPC